MSAVQAFCYTAVSRMAGAVLVNYPEKLSNSMQARQSMLHNKNRTSK